MGIMVGFCGCCFEVASRRRESEEGVRAGGDEDAGEADDMSGMVDY